jgi:hypothetical protein
LLPHKAEELAGRFSRLLAAFIHQDEQRNSKCTGSLAKQNEEWDPIFQSALAVKIDLMLTPHYYRLISIQAGSTFDERTMEAQAVTGLAIKNQWNSLHHLKSTPTMVTWCLFPALFVYPAKPLPSNLTYREDSEECHTSGLVVNSRLFLSQEAGTSYLQDAGLVSKAIVLVDG